MALRSKSLFLYGFEITDNNKYIDFVRVVAGPQLTGVLTVGFYSLTGLLTAIKQAMEAVDTTNTYTVSANRTINGGLENRVTISTNGSHLDLLFGSGTHNAASVHTLIGFMSTDQTGSTTYTGTSTAGTAFTTEREGYNYLSVDNSRKVFGAVNVSAAGIKEAIVFNIQQFIEVDFRDERFAIISTTWTPFFNWSIQQKPFDFTPEVLIDATIFYDVTLEKTSADGQGLAFAMREMLPERPFRFSTGLLTMRKRVT